MHQITFTARNTLGPSSLCPTFWLEATGSRGRLRLLRGPAVWFAVPFPFQLLHAMRMADGCCEATFVHKQEQRSHDECDLGIGPDTMKSIGTQ